MSQTTPHLLVRLLQRLLRLSLGRGWGAAGAAATNADGSAQEAVPFTASKGRQV